MEKLLNQEERIRRAEEIYARRQNLRERTKKATLSVSEPRNFKLLKRVILQIVICVLIYFIFYLINTTDYSFSQATLTKADEIMSYDVNFMEICQNIINFIGDYINKINNYQINNTNEITNAREEENANIQENNDEQNIQSEKLDNNLENSNQNENFNGENSNQNENSNEENNNQNENSNGENNNQTGEVINTNNEEATGQEQISYVNMSETDRIKNSYSFIIPASRKYYFKFWRKGSYIQCSIYIS